MNRILKKLSKGALLATSAGAATIIFTGAASAQTAEPSTTAPAATIEAPVATTEAKPNLSDKATGDEIIVLGTRRTDRTLTNSASPVDVISAAELKSQPSANLIDSLKNIVPSFFVGQNTISDASSLVRAPSLRGLPSDQVLVMLNGKRYNRSALVQTYNGGDTGLSFGSQGSDMGAIPSIAIKSLQILREGATAQYGSDAIAGVLNYGLRDDAGFEVEGRYGQFYKNGDGKSKQISADAGVKGEWGFVNLAGEYDHDGQTSRGATRPSAILFAQDNPSLASQLPNYPLPAQIWGNSPSHGFKLLLNSAANVTDNSKLYFFANYAKNHVNESFNFRSSLTTPHTILDTAGVAHTILGREFFQSPFYQTVCPAGNLTCPAGGYVQDSNVFLLSSVYPAGFTPRFVGNSNEKYGTLGYKGSSGGFHYDLSASLSRNSLALSVYDSFAPTFGSASQTSFEFGKLIQKEFDANLDMTYEVNAGFASPITLSWGGEYRKETYVSTTGDPQTYLSGPYLVPHELYAPTSVPGVYTDTGTTTAAYDDGARGYAGTSPTYAGSFSDKSWGVYGGAEADITNAWTAGVAGRYEHYKSSGGAFVYKVNTLYKLSNVFSVRGTIGTGFHAPSPGQNNVQSLTTNFILGNSVQVGTFPVTKPIAQYYGAKPLKPEKSTNYGLGLVFKPQSNLSVTVDAYKIDVKDRIFISAPFLVTAADIVALPDLAPVGVGGNVQYFTNSFDTTTKGVDVVATYRTGLADGNLNLTLAYNYNISKAKNFDPTVVSLDQRIDIKHLAPNHRGTLSAAWSKGAFGLNARANYFGTWIDANDYPVRNSSGALIDGQHFGAKVTADLDLSYTFMDHYTLTVGGINIFNTYPDRIKASVDNPIYPLTNSTSDGQIYPRSGGPFGINGGFWYVKVGIKY